MSQQECPICLEPVSQEKNCMITECGHCFHSSCIMQNASLNGFQCPYCRTKMADEQDSDSDDDSDDDDSDDDSDDDYNDENAAEYFDDFWSNIENRTSYSEELENQLSWSESPHEEEEPVEEVQWEINRRPNNPTPEELTAFLKMKGVTMENVVQVLLTEIVDEYYCPEHLYTPEYKKIDGLIFNNLFKYIRKYDEKNLHHIIPIPKQKTQRPIYQSESKQGRTSIDYECL